MTTAPFRPAASRTTVAPTASTAPCRVSWRLRLGASIICVRCTPSGDLAVVATVDGAATLVNSSGRPLWTRTLPAEAWAAAITDDGARVAVGSASTTPAAGQVTVLDRHGAEVWHQDMPAPVWSVAFSPDARYLAATSWDGRVSIFESRGDSYEAAASERFGGNGAYGVSITPGGRLVVAVYDVGIVTAGPDLADARVIRLGTGLYNAAAIGDTGRAVVGLREGAAAVIDLHAGSHTVLPRLSDSPICGVAASALGDIMAVGGFDGRAHLIGADGVPFWSITVDGEVWSLALTDDASLLWIGAGDGALTCVHNAIDDSVARALHRVEQRVRMEPEQGSLRGACDALIDSYTRLGTIEYGCRRLEELLAGRGDLRAECLKALLLADVESDPSRTRSALVLAEVQRSLGEWHLAARSYLRAARDGELRMEALLGAAHCFQQAGMMSAARSCYRRSREQKLIADERRVLYSLARSYEDSGDFVAARKHYEVLFADDPDYRDAYERLMALDGRKAAGVDRDGPRAVDHSALRMSVLGPDVPRLDTLDPSLRRVLHARTRELAVSPQERNGLLRELGWLEENALLRDRGVSLSYDEIMYLRYDHSVPEDELKKHLELVNLLAALRGRPMPEQSLDIGSATGRHPSVMARRGVRAFGLDIEHEAARFARRKVGHPSNPTFLVGDGRQLPLASGCMDLITCMMGTIAHMPRTGQEDLCREARRCLCPGGVFVASTWDIECRHLSFLSMYSHEERECIRRQSFTRAELHDLLHTLGFHVAVRPFVMLPDVFSYELGVQRLAKPDLERLIEMDLAMRSVFPAAHGEMFLLVATKQPDGQRS